MNVFLPVKPEYAFKILSGEKKFEFRKRAFREKVNNIVLYASSPCKKILGYFEVGAIHKDSPEGLWKKFNQCAGIDKKDFFSYFSNAIEGFSIEVKSVFVSDEKISPDSVIPNFKVPQSFRYLGDEEFEAILSSL